MSAAKFAPFTELPRAAPAAGLSAAFSWPSLFSPVPLAGGSGSRSGAFVVWYCQVVRSYARVVGLYPEKKPSFWSVSWKPPLIRVAALVKLTMYSSKYFLLVRM